MRGYPRYPRTLRELTAALPRHATRPGTRWLGEAVRVLGLVLQAHQVDDVDEPHLQLRQAVAQDRGRGERLSAQFDALFTADRPVIFAYHGYPWLIHRLTYRRTNHRNLHVRGYKEEGTTTTPFDNVMLNDMDRYHLVMDVIDRVPGLGQRAAGLRQEMVDERLRKRAYTREHGDDPEDIRDWVWPF